MLTRTQSFLTESAEIDADSENGLRWQGAIQIRYITPILNAGDRDARRPELKRVSVVHDISQVLRAATTALSKQWRRDALRTLAFVLLPLFAVMTVLTAYELGTLAVISLLAPIAFFAGYTVHVSNRGERKAARRQRRVEAEVRRRLEDIDPAESMYSLNYFEARLEQEVKRCSRHEIPLCVVTLQLPAGDDDGWTVATARLVTIASQLLRAEDSICHIAGRGYAISLPHTTPAGAGVVISRLAQELSAESPEFGLAYLPPGREVASPALIEHALRTPVKPETAAAAASRVEGREGEVAA